MSPTTNIQLNIKDLFEKLNKYRHLFDERNISMTLQRLADETSLTPQLQDFTNLIIASLMGICHTAGVSPEIAMQNAIVRMEGILDSGKCPFFEPRLTYPPAMVDASQAA